MGFFRPSALVGFLVTSLVTGLVSCSSSDPVVPWNLEVYVLGDGQVVAEDWICTAPGPCTRSVTGTISLNAQAGGSEAPFAGWIVVDAPSLETSDATSAALENDVSTPTESTIKVGPAESGTITVAAFFGLEPDLSRVFTAGDFIPVEPAGGASGMPGGASGMPGGMAGSQTGGAAGYGVDDILAGSGGIKDPTDDGSAGAMAVDEGPCGQGRLGFSYFFWSSEPTGPAPRISSEDLEDICTCGNGDSRPFGWMFWQPNTQTDNTDDEALSYCCGPESESNTKYAFFRNGCRDNKPSEITLTGDEYTAFDWGTFFVWGHVDSPRRPFASGFVGIRVRDNGTRFDARCEIGTTRQQGLTSWTLDDEPFVPGIEICDSITLASLDGAPQIVIPTIRAEDRSNVPVDQTVTLQPLK